MKKLLLPALLMIAALPAAAQTLKVTVDGQEVQNGQTVDLHCLNVSIDDSWPGYVFYDCQFEPQVCVTSDKDVTINAQVENTSGLTYPMVQFCWPDGCEEVPAGTSTSHVSALEAGKETNMLIESSLFQDLPQEKMVLSFTFRLATTAVYTFAVNVNMIYDPLTDAAVDGISADENLPVEYYDLLGRRLQNPAKGQIVIERQGAKSVKKVY